MAEKDIISEIDKDSKDFTNSLGSYHEITYSETNIIYEHVYNQTISPDFHKEHEMLRGPNGFEPIITIKGKGIIIQKRIFHTSNAETVTGADFILTKRKGSKQFELAIQVKRNRRKPSFEFNSRDSEQLNRFASYFPFGYYMFVDEMGDMPQYCFVTVREIKKILNKIGDKKSIPNSEIKEYCRGAKMFYDSFYLCRRGSRINESFFVSNIKEYVDESNRIIIELFAEQKNGIKEKNINN